MHNSPQHISIIEMHCTTKYLIHSLSYLLTHTYTLAFYQVTSSHIMLIYFLEQFYDTIFFQRNALSNLTINNNNNKKKLKYQPEFGKVIMRTIHRYIHSYITYTLLHMLLSFIMIKFKPVCIECKWHEFLLLFASTSSRRRRRRRLINRSHAY